MNRTDIEKAVAEALGGDSTARVNARTAVDTVVRSVNEALVAGDRVYIRDLGVFRAQVVPSRMVRNPMTNKKTRAKKTSRVRFTVSTSLKDWITAGKMPKVPKAVTKVAEKVTPPARKTAAKVTPAKVTPAKVTPAKTTSPKTKAAGKSKTTK